jgi:hypothetical protein
MSRLWIYLERTLILQGVVILVFVLAVLTHVLIGNVLPVGVWIVLACALGLWYGMFSQFNAHSKSHNADGEGGLTGNAP